MNTSTGQTSVSQSTKKTSNQNIQVYARVRPLNARERSIRSSEVIDVISPREIVTRHSIDSKLTKKFTFDRSFGPDSRQVEVYSTVVAPLIEEVLSGYNCTVFAYGQTGTGKTHTMVGTECAELKSSWEDKMAQNCLYMLEFVVDDLLITRPNCCAPEEYPICCEISFRSSVFISIRDREFGTCVDTCPCTPCAKCCLFSLESPITEKDCLFIHIYKKKTDQCKFLVGATNIPMKPLFDKVTESFNIGTPNWMKQLAKHTADPKSAAKTTIADHNCGEEALHREQCPTSELTKRLLPLFNMRNLQTGNLVLIMRLVCNGPALVYSFPFSKLCSTSCGGKKQQFCSSRTESPRTPCPICLSQDPSEHSGAICTMTDPCTNDDSRYFAYNAGKGCFCDECEKEEEFSEEEYSEPIPPCFNGPSKPGSPSPEAYEEFEACFKENGLVIRVLKDTHFVQGIVDGSETCLAEGSSEGDNSLNIKEPNKCEKLTKILQRSVFAGHIFNHPKPPKIGANINDDYSSDNYHLPFTRIKYHSEKQDNKLNMYRKNKSSDEWECRLVMPKHEADLRNCCLQVDPAGINNSLNDINADARKKGIEVCYKTCDDTKSDVFLVKLGSKQRCQKKNNSIEIELKTPKQSVTLPIQKVTTETQINGVEIDAAISGGKKNGKKGKKRRNKGK